MLLIGTSMSMSWIMAYENIPQNITAALLAVSDSKFVILITINLILLFVGVFMDMTPAVLIFTPSFTSSYRIGYGPYAFWNRYGA